VIVAGIDTGIGTCGWSRFDTASRRFVALGAFETEKQHHKQKTDDHDDRTAIVADVLASVVEGADIVVAERRSFASAASIGPISLCFGVIVGLVRALPQRPRLYTVAPKVWQHAVVEQEGRINYEDIERSVGHFLRRDSGCARTLDALAPDLREHALDASAIALMGAFRLQHCRPIGGRGASVEKHHTHEVSHG
jgi:hypothetical protein